MKETEVSNAIKNGFLYFRLLARADLERNWKNMSLQQRWAAGRALVYIGRLAKNPRMYLSRKIVVDNFLEDIKKNVKHVDLDQKLRKASVYYPADVVRNDTKAAFIFNNELGREFYKFCETVEYWEDCISENSSGFIEVSEHFVENNIFSETNRLAARVKSKESSFYVRLFLKNFRAQQK